MNNIILCGFMGCGKTTAGKLLAQRLQMQYTDLDKEIEEKTGRTIPEIFAESGESGFRDIEHEIIKTLAYRQNHVVSTGGGAMTFERNVRAVDNHDRVVFLDASFEACYRRIKDSDRPIVIKNTPEQLRHIYLSRFSAYERAASIRVNADLSCERVAAEIIAAINI